MPQPEQAGLSLFPDRTVSYNVIQPHGPNGEYPHPAWETVHVGVDEIDAIDDDRLRAALWRQFEADEANARSRPFIFTKLDGSFSHSFSIPTRPLGVRFTAEGIVEDSGQPNPESREVKVDQAEHATSRVAKVLRWLR